jgi:hypothetical protein
MGREHLVGLLRGDRWPGDRECGYVCDCGCLLHGCTAGNQEKDEDEHGGAGKCHDEDLAKVMREF